MSEAFGSLSPAGYHQWRLDSELYRGVERAVMLPILQSIPFRRALDIGCGSGLWTCELKRLRPQSECIGIDISSGMVEFAAGQCEASFMAADALTYRDPRRFELLISALSADYIGFPGFFATLAANLTVSGTAIAWFLDPRRYPRAGHHLIKTWKVAGREVRVKIPNYDVTRVNEMCAAAGMICTIVQTPFRLQDQIERTFLCIRCVLA